ncbi:uncharacterized protein LOC125293731 [Alosa alosa]|uniref:uncharacterized protein LOC125293731 n=1 Tax=Alosa alosa TaxID=278164 RepID=UPI00201542AB|nr:uncharacterized protein LOC125293731 [Alosa alosa]
MMKPKLIGKVLLLKWCMLSIVPAMNPLDMHPITSSSDCPLISCLAFHQVMAAHPIKSMQRNGEEGWKRLTSLASKATKGCGKRGKDGYDRKIHGAELSPGCRVLIRNLTERDGPGKLRSFWEERVHVVVKRKHPDSPVYEVQPEDGQGRTRVLHRNLLLPCDFLPVEMDTPEKNRGEKQHKQKKSRPTQYTEPESSSDSEEDEWRCISGWSQGDSPRQTRSNLRADATEFQPQTAAPALEGDDGMERQNLWTSDSDGDQEDMIKTELEQEVPAGAAE